MEQFDTGEDLRQCGIKEICLMCVGGELCIQIHREGCPYINYGSADRSSGEQLELIPYSTRKDSVSMLWIENPTHAPLKLQWV